MYVVRYKKTHILTLARILHNFIKIITLFLLLTICLTINVGRDINENCRGARVRHVDAISIVGNGIYWNGKYLYRQ